MKFFLNSVVTVSLMNIIQYLNFNQLIIIHVCYQDSRHVTYSGYQLTNAIYIYHLYVLLVDTTF